MRRNTCSQGTRNRSLAIRFLLEGEASGGSVALFEFDVPAGANVPVAHSHDGVRGDGLRARGRPDLDPRRQTDVGPGEALCIPRGAVHRFDNHEGVDAKVLAIVTPGILGPDYFRDLAAIVDAAAGGPPDLAAIAGVMKRHVLSPAP